MNSSGSEQHVIADARKPASIDSSIYPPTYMLNTPKMDDILTSLVIAIASYAPCQETGVSKRELMSWEKDCHFLLTCDQLQLLWTRQFTKELWVHGPPGAGKTVAALHMIQELVARGCDRPQVLYLAENPLLCTYIRSFTLCKVASRRELLEDRATPGRFLAKYRQVKNVIVDEAQNFKDRDGDWYSLAEQLACLGAEHIVQSDQGSDMLTSTSQGQTSKATLQQCAVDGVSTKDFHGSMTVTPCGDASPAGTNIEDDRSSEQAYKHQVSPPKRPRSSKTELTSGYFWVFMDYAQKVHKFKAGLPGLIGKNNFMLSEISRNSKEIFDYAMKFMSKPSDAVQQGRGWVEDAPVLGHDYQNGQGVEVVRCNKDSVHRTLFSVLESYLGNGMKPDDIAILVSKSKEKEAVEKFVKQDLLQKDSEDSDQTGQSSCDVTVDTVRRFSGLDKPVVIGVEPHADTDHADLDKFIVNLATRAKDGLVIITTSDHLMRKLQIQ